MAQKSFGSYLRGTISPWNNGSDPFAESSGTNVAFNQQFTNLTSYEFGFLFNTGRLSYRLGFELIQPTTLAGVTGVGSSGATYYSLDSSVSAYLPKLGLEYNIKTWKNSRVWCYAEYGYATAAIQNTYTFTPAGSAQYGLSNFREVVTGTQSEYAASFGAETLMTDSATISAELGYRELNFGTLSMANAVTNFQGNQLSGSPALRNDGATSRTLNMSGFFASVNLRFWIY